MLAQTSGKSRKLAECTESKCTSLVIAHINIRSMRNKVDELQLLLKKLSIDIMCVSETWLTDTITDNTANIAGYDITRCDRISNSYGGVAILIRDNLVHKIRDDLKTEKSMEILWIEVQYQFNKTILVTYVYRPPTASVAYFNDMVDTIEKAHNTDKHMVILGDMNYNYVFDETMSENPICLLDNMFLLKQLIDAPTRVTENSSSLIDIILTNEPNHHEVSGVYKSSISDHYLVHTKIASNTIKANHKN